MKQRNSQKKKNITICVDPVQYEIFKNKILINQGYTKLIFFNKRNNKPIRCPKNILEAISSS